MSFLYACRIEISFPTNGQAEQAMQVLQVDREPGDRVVKAFSLVKEEGEGDEELTVLRVDLKATEAKMLRVAASSFYDFLQVVVKTFQEFGDSSSS